jgi:hypothetical protein
MADGELSKALPLLANAIKKVDLIEVKDFYELRAMGTPSPSVVACFKIICFFFIGHACKP